MKYFTTYLLIAVACFSCKNDDDTPDWSTASALKNGVYWEAEIKVVDNSNHPRETGLLIIIQKDNGDGFDDFMQFVNVPAEVGRYILPDTSGNAQDSTMRIYYITAGTDVIGDTFTLLTEDAIENYIEITDISDDEIMGTFQLSFLRNTTSPPANPGTPDTLLFTEGQIHTWIRY